MANSHRNRVLIIEPRADGHHGPYLEWMVQGLISRGFRVSIITLPQSIQHPSMKVIKHMEEEMDGEVLRFISAIKCASPIDSKGSIRGLASREIAYWRMFRTWYREYADSLQPNVVFLPYLDYCLYTIGLIGSPFDCCPWVGIAMRPSFHYQNMGVEAPRPAFSVVKRALFHRLLKNKYLRCLITIDEPLSKYLGQNDIPATKHAFFREPVEISGLLDSRSAKRNLGFSADRKLILVYGDITSRKGVFHLLRALTLPEFPPFVDVLIAGKLSEEINDGLVTQTYAGLIANGRLHILNRFILKEEQSVLFAAADIVWLGYRGHYTPSGVLVQAASTGRPVISSPEGIVGWQTRRHNLGKIVNPEQPAELIEAIISLLGNESDWVNVATPDRRAVFGRISDAVEVLARGLTDASDLNDRTKVDDA